MGFIEEFRDFALNELPNSDPRWLEEIAMSALSATVGTSYQVSSLGGLTLNVFIMGIGPSRLGVKTLPFKYLKPMLEPINRMLPEEFTKEGLIEYLSDNDFSEGLILKDEATTLFKQPKYNETLLEFLSNLYSGQGMSRYTKSSNSESIQESSVSLLSATTESLYQVMKPNNFIQGFGNRLLYNKLDTRHVSLKSNEYFRDPKFISKQRGILENRFISWLEKLMPKKPKIHLGRGKRTQKTNIEFIEITKRAKEKLTSFRNETNNKGIELYEQNATNLLSSYYGSCGEFCNKLAGLKAISDVFPSTDWSRIVIDNSVAEWAIDRTYQYVDTFEQIISEWRSRPMDKQVESDEPYLIMIRKAIKKNMDNLGFFHKTSVAKSVPLSSTKFKTYLDTLIQRGELYMFSRNQLPPKINQLLSEQNRHYSNVIYAFAEKYIEVYENEVGSILSQDDIQDIDASTSSDQVMMLKYDKLSRLHNIN